MASHLLKQHVITKIFFFCTFVFQNSSKLTHCIIWTDCYTLKTRSLKLNYQPCFDAAIGAVQAGQADGIIAGMFRHRCPALLTSTAFHCQYYPCVKTAIIASCEDLKREETVG